MTDMFEPEFLAFANYQVFITDFKKYKIFNKRNYFI